MYFNDKLSPANSLLLLMDMESGQLPDSMSESLVAFTDTCIAFGTMQALDGETTIQIDSDLSEETENHSLVYDGRLNLPSKKISLVDTLNQEIWSSAVDNEIVGVKIFANDDSEPDSIRIIVDRSGE